MLVRNEESSGTFPTSRLASLCFLLIFPVFLFPQDQARDRQEIEQHIERAEAALKANQTSAIVDDFRAVITLDLNNVAARANLGVIACVQAACTKADEDFRQLRMLQPFHWKAKSLLRMCEERQGRFSSEQTLPEKSFPDLQDHKLRTLIGVNLAQLDYRSGKLTRTEEVLSVLEQFDPINVEVLYTCYPISSALAAHAEDSTALIDPNSAGIYQIVAQHLVNEGSIQGAIAQYRHVPRLDPRFSGAHLELGEAIFQNSKSEPARTHAQREFQAVLALNLCNSESECRLGEVYC